jgi:hypothetical protein
VFKPSDPSKVEFWMRVAAENGNAGYMMVYADHLHQQGGNVYCERAVYWLRRAISANPAVTADAERKIQAIRDNKECLRT